MEHRVRQVQSVRGGYQQEEEEESWREMLCGWTRAGVCPLIAFGLACCFVGVVLLCVFGAVFGYPYVMTNMLSNDIIFHAMFWPSLVFTFGLALVVGGCMCFRRAKK